MPLARVPFRVQVARLFLMTYSVRRRSKKTFPHFKLLMPVKIITTADQRFTAYKSSYPDHRRHSDTWRDPLGYFDSLEKLLRAIGHHPNPVISMIHGSIWGGACDLVTDILSFKLYSIFYLRLVFPPSVLIE